MNPKLLELKPTRYLCPYCGEWHKWNESELTYHDSERYEAQHRCSIAPQGCNDGDYRIYFYDGYCYYSTARMCNRANQLINGRIPISSIIESKDKPTVTFEVPFTAASDVGTDICSTCSYRHECIYPRLGDEGDARHMKIPFGFEFDEVYYAKVSKQFNKNGGDTTMANNNIFNMNVEFGPNKDENIASTLMGVAVKNGDSWRIYNKEKKEITDVGDMQLGNLPIFIIPSTKIAEGDLIKDDGEYYFVTKVATAKSPTQTLSVRTGEIKSVVPIKNILGFNCYSKVVALSDSLNMGDDLDVEKLAIMSAMFSQTGNSGNLLPLILFKDKLGGDDDTMKLVLMSSMMTSEDDGSQTNQLLPLLLFKDKLGGDDDTMKLVLMSSMMGCNMAGFDNPLMSYLMLDSFIGKKDGEAPQTGDGAAE